MTNTPNTEMVERVARALCFANHSIADEHQEYFWTNPTENPFMMTEDGGCYDEGYIVGRTEYRRSARAAIAEVFNQLAEPSERMIEAHTLADLSDCRVQARTDWQAMLQQARYESLGHE